MKTLKLILFALIWCITSSQAQTSINAIEGIPKESYKYWPNFNYSNNISSVKAQEWVETDHTIEGWDFSLPNGLKPSERSSITTIFSYKLSTDEIKPAPKSTFPMNIACEMWVNWREIEPIEGVYRWDQLKKSILSMKAKGYNVLLRILTSGYSCHDDPELGYAPKWMENYDITKMEFPPKLGKSGVKCYYPGDPNFHSRYVKLVDGLGKSGIPDLVQGAYVGYGYRSPGEERISPMGTVPDTIPHVIERLDAWGRAFKGQTHKVYMGGNSEHGFELGFGIRRGFVEMYWCAIPETNIGQHIDQDGYLYINEEAHVIAKNTFNYEINEMYHEMWATEPHAYLFGNSTDSFSYRYFMSQLRSLQMRCSAVVTRGNLIPEMIPFLSMELGRTIDDTPDIWSFMCSTTLKAGVFRGVNFDGSKRTFYRELTSEDFGNGIEAKHFERWLYQRDRVGYETEPAMKIPHAIRMGQIHLGKNHDYIARRGAKIGFYADDRFDEHKGKKAIKITYLDEKAGKMVLKYKDKKGRANSSTVELCGDNCLKTSTIILDNISLVAPTAEEFDFTLEAQGGASDICVSMVRIVKI